MKPNVPEASVVAVPICLKLPFEPRTFRVTVTPVKSVGHGWFWYAYSIQPLMLSSETHGRPLGKFFATSLCWVHFRLAV